ncbi:MAG: hypothetical protein NC416_03480 [Eubacterium sp.]|nr:hypothetical protein [Eubacterium sp.]
MHRKNQWNSLFAIEQDIAYEAHMRDTVRLMHLEACRLNLSAKPTLSFTRLTIKQLKFLAWKIWLFQGIVLAALCSVFFLVYTVDFNRWSGDTLLKLLCGCSAVVAMSSIPVLKRSSMYKMFELEQSTHFALRGSLLSQLLFIGIDDLCMLTVLALVVWKHGLTMPAIIAPLILPFLTASTACLMLWSRIPSDSFQTVGVAFCLLSALTGYEFADKINYLPVAGQFCLTIGYLLTCIGIMYHEYCRFLSRKPIEKML